MNMFARLDENQAMTLQDIKESKRYGRTDARTDGRTDGQRENSIPTTNKVCGIIKSFQKRKHSKGSLTLAMGKCVWFLVKIKVCQSSFSSP